MTDSQYLKCLGARLALEAADPKVRVTLCPPRIARDYEPIAGVCHPWDELGFRRAAKAPSPARVNGLDARRLALMGLEPFVCVWAGEAE